MASPLAPTRPTPGRIVGGLALLALAGAVTALASAVAGRVQTPLVVTGIAAITASAIALIVLYKGHNSHKYLGAAMLWGLGALIAGLFPDAALGPFPLSPLAFAVAGTGLLLVLLQLLVRARAGSDDLEYSSPGSKHR